MSGLAIGFTGASTTERDLRLGKLRLPAILRGYVGSARAAASRSRRLATAFGVAV